MAPLFVAALLTCGYVIHSLLDQAAPSHLYSNLALIVTSGGAVGILWWATYQSLRQRHAEQEVQAAAVFQSAPDGLIILSQEMVVQAFNPAAEHLFGLAAHEVVGHPLLERMAPEAAVRCRELVDRLRNGEWDGSEIEDEAVRPDGSRTPVGIQVTPISGPNGCTHLCTVRDLTARKQCEQAQIHYEVVAANVRAILLVLDARGQILEANPAAAEAYGVAREALEGRHISTLMAPGAPAGVDLPDTGGDVEVVYETIHRGADGRTFPVSVFQAAVVRGRLTTHYAIIQDMTGARQASTVQEIMHQMDHRILERQPIEAIFGYVCDTMTKAWDLSGAFVALVQKDGSLRIQGEAGPAPAQVDLLLHNLLAVGQPELITVGVDPLPAEREASLRSLGVTQALILPLTIGEAVIGALALFAPHPFAFGEESRGQLALVAGQLARTVRAAEAHQRLTIQDSALEAADNAIVITDQNGVIQWCNPAWQRLTGYSSSEVVGHTPRVLKSGVHPQLFYQNLWDTILAGETWRGVVQNRRKDGELYLDEQTITPVRNAQGEITHFIAIKQDVTERRRQEEQLRYLTTFDPHTDLPNRRVLRHTLERTIRLSCNGESGALLFLVLEDVDLLTTSLGDVVAQDLMINAASVLRRSISGPALLASWAANQFAVVFMDATEEGARAQTDTLRRAIAEHTFYVGGHRFGPSLTCGLAMIDGALDGDGVIALAAAAVHAAREEGMNRTVLFHPEDDQGASRLEPGRWAFRVREAIAEGRLVLHFQPIVRVGTGEGVCYEALLRMRERDGTLVGPGQFLTAVESFGLMPAIDLAVMKKVLAILHQHPALRLFANLSGQSLGDQATLAEIESLISQSGEAATRLVIEITESAAVRDLAAARLWVDRLKQRGCGFALDDFGSGFSSFSYLRVLPVDFVKIDGSFIRGLSTDPTLPVMVRAICAIARSLDKQVIAEWVEDRAVADRLEELGVEFGQGYYWGHPEPLFPGGESHVPQISEGTAQEEAG